MRIKRLVDCEEIIAKVEKLNALSQEILETLYALPTDTISVEYESVEEYKADNGEPRYQCDQCKLEYLLLKGTPNNYCPNCGARME